MALLQGRIPSGVLPERQYDLAITPILPTQDGPRDAYQVAVWRNDEPVFEQTYSVQDFTGGHYVMWQVANLLQYASDMVDQEVRSPVIPMPPEAWCSARPHPLSIRQHATWMDIILSSSTYRGEAGCLLSVYLAMKQISTFAHEPGTGLDQFVAFGLYSTPAEVANFGKVLEEEMVQARRLRDALNLPAAFEEK